MAKSVFNPGVLLNRLKKAEKSTLEHMGDIIVERARSKAPVRKAFREGKTRTRAASPELIAAAVKRINENKKLSDTQRTEALYLLQRHPESARVKIRRRGSPNARRPMLIGKYKTTTMKKLKVGTDQEKLSITEFRGRAGATEWASKPYWVGGDPKANPPRSSRYTRAQHGYSLGQVDDARLSSKARHEIKSGYGLTNQAGESIRRGDRPTKVFYGGRLKNSIEASGSVYEGHVRSIQVGTNVHYAIFVEFPTRHNAAQPFLLPALKESKRYFLPLLRSALREEGLLG